MKQRIRSFADRLTRRILLVMLAVMSITSGLVFFFADGITEAEDPEHALFGMNRLLASARQIGAVAPDTFLRSMKDAVHGFTREAEQSDDMTMLVIRYKQI
ncbi:MAG: serine/threonine-protein phosphatase [Bacteroidales bacterium]|nr:serine/threonine-protein phosphatase [Bacteroidales bacterium]